jgi:hypothetical protein
MVAPAFSDGKGGRPGSDPPVTPNPPVLLAPASIGSWGGGAGRPRMLADIMPGGTGGKDIMGGAKDIIVVPPMTVLGAGKAGRLT